MRLFERWARARLAGVSGATVEVVRLPGRTPVIDLPGEVDDTVLRTAFQCAWPQRAPAHRDRPASFSGDCAGSRGPCRAIRRRIAAFSAGFRHRGLEPRAMRGRRADVIALKIADPLGAQQDRIRIVFYALGNRAQAETLG